MFTHSKKDYYSVNADIAIEANQQQRIFEAALHITNQNAYNSAESQQEGGEQTEEQQF
jgi:hypothetical protein